MDDTRDIAIEAKASASSAHKRLDSINGQIARLGTSHERMRETFDEAINDPNTGLRAELAGLRSDVKVSGAKLALLVALASLVFGAGTSAVVSHYLNHPASPKPAQAAGR